MPLQIGSEIHGNMRSCSPRKRSRSPVHQPKKNKKPARTKKPSSSSTSTSSPSLSKDRCESKGSEGQRPGDSEREQESASSKPEGQEVEPVLDPLESASDEALRELLAEQLAPQVLPVGRLYRPGLHRPNPSTVVPAIRPRPVVPGLISHGSRPG